MNPVTNQIYVSNLEIGSGDLVTVSVIDGSTNTITGSIPIPQTISCLGVDTVRNVIWVVYGPGQGNSFIASIDGATNTLSAPLQIGYNDRTFALNETTNTLYVPDNHGSQLYVIDGSTVEITGTIAWPDIPNQSGLAVNPVTNTIYVPGSNGGGTSGFYGGVDVLDGATNTVTARLSVPVAGPLLVDSVTNKIWLVGGPAVVIDGVTNAETTVSLSGMAFTSVPAGALNTTTNYAYMAGVGNVYVISGAPAGPAFSASPSPLTFGNQTQGTTSSAMTLTVTNTGTSNLSITTVTAAGTNMADFIIGSDSCSNATVAAAKTCTVSVQFDPSTTAGESATLTFTDNASGSPETVTLTGTGVAPIPTATTTKLAASATSVVVGTSVTLTATVTPASGTPTPTGTVTFKDGTTTLGTGTLNGSGVATYSAAALTVGSHSTTASYAGDSRNTASAAGAVVVSVTSGATTTALTASAASIAVGASVTFTATVTGASGVPSPTGTVTFMNGTATLGTGTLSSGTATFTAPSLIAAVYSVTAAYGGDTNNAASTSSAVAVTVWPGAPSLSISLSPASDSASSGSPAMTTATVTSINGFASATSLSCSGLPKNSVCDFSASSVTPAVSGTATSTLTIKTDTTATTAVLDPSWSAPESHARRVASRIAIANILGALPLLPFLGSKHRKLQSLGAFLLFAILAAGAMTGCGGGPTTPAGAYSIQITAASGSITQQATFSLTVK